MREVFFATAKDLQLHPNNQKEWLSYLEKMDGKKLVVYVERETGVRSGAQNRALHKGFEIIADTLNAAGLDIRKVLKPSVEINWTGATVKEYLFKPVMKLVTGKEHTSEADKGKDLNDTWDTVMKFLGENHGVEYIAFPHEEVKTDTVEYTVRDESNTPIL